MLDHRTHDPTLIAGLAAGDLSAEDRARAQVVLHACHECTTLHGDLLAIAAATRSLPKRATAPRDYRISPEQASRLQRRSWLRMLLAPFAGATSAARPLATAFTSLGLVGLLVVTVLPGMLGGAASMAPERQSTGGAGAMAAPSAAPAQPIDNASATTAPGPNGPGTNTDSMASGTPDNAYGAKDNVATPGTAGDADQESGTAGLRARDTTNPLLLGSLVLLAIGLGLFALRFAGRRLR